MSLSIRKQKFLRLARVAYEQPSYWLVATLQDTTRNNGHLTALARLACLHALVCLDYGINSPSGLPYQQRKLAVRQAIGI